MCDGGGCFGRFLTLWLYIQRILIETFQFSRLMDCTLFIAKKQAFSLLSTSYDTNQMIFTIPGRFCCDLTILYMFTVVYLPLCFNDKSFIWLKLA